MPDKPNTPFALDGHRLVVLHGPDAVRFAHAHFMSDVAGLEDGHWHWSGWLTPKGRVVALFALLRIDPGLLWLLLPDADPGDFVAQLRRFVFRSKVAIEAPDGVAVGGAFAAPMQARAGRLAGSVASGFELDVGGDGGARVLRVGPAAHAAADAAGLADWRLADLEHGLPRLDGAQSGEWTPQQLSLERLQAFSVRKGCYPGQEIVARTHFLGKAKRGLALLGSGAPLVPGAAVRADARDIGQVVSTASAGGRHVALAVLPLARDPGPLEVDGTPVRESPLLDGLAR